MKFEQIKEIRDRIRENITQVIAGKEEVIDRVLVAFLCGGHVLLEDVPGVGKTMLAKCLARSTDCEFRRIQFTPDLLPSDLTGIHFFDRKQEEFVFRPGPLFTQIVLVDEINRATPRTQASLLECMEEEQITVDGVTRKLTEPFFVIATQNPVETRGTFPLPEAQLDRFFMRIQMGYPSAMDGRRILDRFQEGNPLAELRAVVTAAEVVQARTVFKHVTVGEDLKDYIVSIIEATRAHSAIALGVSPRGSLALMRAAQMLAVFRERDFVTPDDVKAMAAPVLAHRMVLGGSGFSSAASRAEAIIEEILAKVHVPTEEA